jgi:hypothetical protein
LLDEKARTAMQEWHQRWPYECAAHAESQYCCIDFLLGDTREEW